MKFVVNKDDLLNGIRIIERATVVKGLQPVLANVLIETVGDTQIKLSATDYDLSITTLIDAQVELEGKYTLIEECSSNAKYINGLEPLLAGIAQNSYESYDKNIITPPDMRNNTFKRARFSELKTGLQVLPEKRFAEFIDRASERSKIIMLNA